MRIKSIEIYHIDMPMKFIFSTAKESLNHRESLIIKAVDEEGLSGFGEVVSFATPFYTKETLETSKKALLKEYLPFIIDKEITHPFEIHKWFKNGYPMAIAGLENALLNIYAVQQGKNIIQLVFDETLSEYAEMGIVLGDMPLHRLKEEIQKYEAVGCKRFKIKIKPLDGISKVQALVMQFPHLKFAVDANRSFQLSQLKALKQLEGLNLMCIEEPFTFMEMEEAKNMQQRLKIPICLDESIQNMEDLEKAVKWNLFQVVNLKIGKLGGLYHVREMVKYCRAHNIKYWVGSMIETGISKILHVELAGIVGTYMPGDLSDSRRYFERDLIYPEIKFNKGKMKIPQEAGLGVQIDEAQLEKVKKDKWIIGGGV